MRTNLDSKAAYLLTHQEGKVAVSEADLGKTYKLNGYYLQEKDSFNEKDMLFIKTDSETLVTTSAAFIRTFVEVLDIFGDDVSIRIVEQRSSKNGKKFYLCEWVES